MEFDIITFDCYGTLIDWERGITDAFVAMLGPGTPRDQIISAYMRIEPVVEGESYRSYRDILTETAIRVAESFGVNLSESDARTLAESVTTCKPFPDTGPALESLASKYRLGILSNIDDDLLAETRKLFPVEFDLIVTAQQVRSYKPGTAHFIEALNRTRGRRLLHAAQSYFHDVVPCTELGIPVIWVNRKNETPPAAIAQSEVGDRGKEADPGRSEPNLSREGAPDVELGLLQVPDLRSLAEALV